MLRAAAVSIALWSAFVWPAPRPPVVLAQDLQCERLAKLLLPNTTITVAQTVAAGAFKRPPAPNAPAPPAPSPFANLPSFCRVAATLTPSSDSDIKIEAWLPTSGWNGKFLGVGNGGWAGTITYPGLADALRRGYAAASTDTGHTGNGGDASFALGHPEKLIDFGYRAVHEMTVTAMVGGNLKGIRPPGCRAPPELAAKRKARKDGTALEQWVEQGRAPDQIVASRSTKGVVDRTRPLCPYPQIAAYSGTGSTDDATNFICRAP